jgi:hypothetical protein
MILKIFKAVWFISMFMVMANLLYVYAGLPEQVVIWEEGLTNYAIKRDILFYSTMGLAAIVNVLVYVFAQSITPDEGFRTWIHGMVITINIFFIIGFSFIGLFNSSESFDFTRAGTVIYLSISLMALWILVWPFYLIYRKYFSKPIV